MTSEITIRLATMEDLPALEATGEEVFDHAIKRDRAIEFLQDPRHHLVLAWFGDRIIGMTSAFHYLHPDKDPMLFVNEVDVRPEFQSRGIGRKLVAHMLQHGRSIGCVEGWIATHEQNLPARKAFVAAGGVEEKEPVVLINYEW